LNGVVTALLAEKGIDIEELLARNVARLPKQ
jgi:riboflavin synthase